MRWQQLNIGCGDDVRDGWTNADCATWAAPDERVRYADLRQRLPWDDDTFTIAVANHVLSDLTHHELPHALRELHRVMVPGGVLRILVPDLMAAVGRYHEGEESWFPQDDRTGALDAKFCTFVTWYGESRSVFTRAYLRELCTHAGFSRTAALPPGSTAVVDDDLAALIVSLDGDRTTALRIEAQK